MVSVGTSAIGIIAAGTAAGAILVGSYKLKDEVVCSTFGGGVAVVHQPQGVGYLEADVDALDVFHGAVFGQFGGTALEGGASVVRWLCLRAPRLRPTWLPVLQCLARYGQGRRFWHLGACVSGCRPWGSCCLRFSCGAVCALLMLLA